MSQEYLVPGREAAGVRPRLPWPDLQSFGPVIVHRNPPRQPLTAPAKVKLPRRNRPRTSHSPSAGKVYNDGESSQLAIVNPRPTA